VHAVGGRGTRGSERRERRHHHYQQKQSCCQATQLSKSGGKCKQTFLNSFFEFHVQRINRRYQDSQFQTKVAGQAHNGWKEEYQ